MFVTVPAYENSMVEADSASSKVLLECACLVVGYVKLKYIGMRLTASESEYSI